MAKYELVKETKPNGAIFYYTTKDGLYVDSSLSSDYNKALEFFNIIKERGSIVPKVEVLESVEVA